MLSPSTREAGEMPGAAPARNSVHWAKVEIHEVAWLKEETWAMTDLTCKRAPRRKEYITQRSIRRVSKEDWICTTCVRYGMHKHAQESSASPQTQLTPQQQVDQNCVEGGVQSFAIMQPLRHLMRIQHGYADTTTSMEKTRRSQRRRRIIRQSRSEAGAEARSSMNV